MAYSDFILARLKSELGITVVEGVSLFGNVAGMEASPLFTGRIETLRTICDPRKY